MTTQHGSPDWDAFWCSVTSPDPSKCFAASVVPQPTIVLERDTTETSTLLLIFSVFVFIAAAANFSQFQLIEAALERLFRKAFGYDERTRPFINLPVTFLAATAVTAVFHYQVHANVWELEYSLFARAGMQGLYFLYHAFLYFITLSKVLFVALLPVAATELLSS